MKLIEDFAVGSGRRTEAFVMSLKVYATKAEQTPATMTADVAITARTQ
jgi:hypothetical protein